MSQPRRKVEKSAPSLPAGQVMTRGKQPGEEPSLAAKRRYTLDELLAQCDATAEITADDRAWLDAAPVGREVL